MIFYRSVKAKGYTIIIALEPQSGNTCPGAFNGGSLYSAYPWEHHPGGRLMEEVYTVLTPGNIILPTASSRSSLRSVGRERLVLRAIFCVSE